MPRYSLRTLLNLLAVGPMVLCSGWIAFASTYQGDLPGGILTSYVTAELAHFLPWVAGLCLVLNEVLNWLRRDHAEG